MISFGVGLQSCVNSATLLFPSPEEIYSNFEIARGAHDLWQINVLQSWRVFIKLHHLEINACNWSFVRPISNASSMISASITRSHTSTRPAVPAVSLGLVHVGLSASHGYFYVHMLYFKTVHLK